MSRHKKQLDLFDDYSPITPRRQPSGGVRGTVKPYLRRPFPTIAALLIVSSARTIRTVFVRATATGLKSVFGDQPVTFQERDFYRAYGIRQEYHELDDRATLPGARLSIQGKILITGPEFTEIFADVSAEIMAGTTFSYCDAYEPQRVTNSITNTHPALSQNRIACQ